MELLSHSRYLLTTDYSVRFLLTNDSKIIHIQLRTLRKIVSIPKIVLPINPRTVFV